MYDDDDDDDDDDEAFLVCRKKPPNFVIFANIHLATICYDIPLSTEYDVSLETIF